MVGKFLVMDVMVWLIEPVLPLALVTSTFTEMLPSTSAARSEGCKVRLKAPAASTVVWGFTAQRHGNLRSDRGVGDHPTQRLCDQGFCRIEEAIATKKGLSVTTGREKPSVKPPPSETLLPTLSLALTVTLPLPRFCSNANASVPTLALHLPSAQTVAVNVLTPAKSIVSCVQDTRFSAVPLIV